MINRILRLTLTAALAAAMIPAQAPGRRKRTVTDAEVMREPSGRPAVVLHGRCLEIARELSIDQWWVSISHISTHAIASAISRTTQRRDPRAITPASPAYDQVGTCWQGRPRAATPRRGRRSPCRDRW